MSCHCQLQHPLRQLQALAEPPPSLAGQQARARLHSKCILRQNHGVMLSVNKRCRLIMQNWQITCATTAMHCVCKTHSMCLRLVHSPHAWLVKKMDWKMEKNTIGLLLTPQGHSSQAHAREAVCLYSIANCQQKQQAVAAIKGCQHAQGNVVHAISAFCFQLCISGLSTAIAVAGLL